MLNLKKFIIAELILSNFFYMDLVSQDYWDNSYQNFSYHVAKDDVTEWIKKYSHFLPVAKGQLFEFGCYPGRYLSFMGKKGWVINGMDLTPGIEKRFPEWLQSLGIKTGLLKQGDALAYAANTHDRFDLVCSFGFIEHFEQFLNMITLHDRILKKDGWLMITTPNFQGAVQRFLHKKFNAETLAIHYLPSMHPDIWKNLLQNLGYEIKYAGYFGHFDFWYDEKTRTGWQRFLLKVIRKVKPILRLLPNSSSYSPYCGILAKKTNP